MLPPGAPVHTLIVMLENHNHSQVIGRQPITHYSVLRTIENLYHLRPPGQAAHATPITNVWR
jgi:hypothetical protein